MGDGFDIELFKESQLPSAFFPKFAPGILFQFMQNIVRNTLVITTLFAMATGCTQKPATQEPQVNADSLALAADSLRYPEEKHLRNVRRLTQGGNNAEAYFSFDGRHLVFQNDWAEWGNACDQIYTMPITGTGSTEPNLVSTGKGRTTCAYFMPGDSLVLYASTHLGADTCPANPPRKVDGRYVWPIYDTYDIFVADLQGNIRRQLTNTKGYDAEATISPDGKKIVFTSTRSGDLELWTMNVDGSELKQITNTLGYDGGAFFSPDSKKLVWRASRPEASADREAYLALLKQGLVQPSDLEVFVADADGSNARQVTKIGKANWAPNWHPSGEKIIFASNHQGETGRQFNLFLVNVDGSGLEQLSFDSVFDAFPMFSPDGKQVVFSSNRFNGGGHDTNVYIADWVE
jgi:Tol biopolymer transport system component